MDRRRNLNMNQTTVTLETDKELYEEAKKVFEKDGYTADEAVTLFFKACVACGGFPFPLSD